VDLGMVPGYTRAFPSAINNSGQVVGWATRWLGEPPVEESVGVLWSNGSVVVLDGMGTARDINDNGQIVGASPDWHAVLWEAGTITRLPQPNPDAYSAALAINNRGQAVGYCDRYSTGGPHSTNGPAILWDRGTAIELLPFPDAQDNPGLAAATAINERGQVVGFVDEFVGVWPLIWEDGGVATQLPFPGGGRKAFAPSASTIAAISSGPRSTMGPSSASSGHGRRTRREKARSWRGGDGGQVVGRQRARGA
jgi:uncharacterized membrane protein